ncbi:MAG: class I SAM-dependent methyltransferase [Planctomycetaceae bacterium]|nr:class I SAM-dependent methyltransferase [Planctomycetaceae bacterium]
MEHDPQKQDFCGKYTHSTGASRWLINRFFSQMSELLQGLDVQVAAEIGCGPGFSTQQLRKSLSQKVVFDASDVEPDLVKLAGERNPDVPVRRESIYHLSRPDHSVDILFVLEVLEHLEHPEQAMAEICRVSRRWAILSVPREPIWCMMNMGRLKYVRSLGNTPGHLNHWTARGFINFVSLYCKVISRRTPLPWTILLCRVS